MATGRSPGSILRLDKDTRVAKQKVRNVRWPAVFKILRAATRSEETPSVTEIAHRRRDPFRVLIATMISLRTKDEVTAEASGRLFAVADTPAATAALSEAEISTLIYPAGFYRTKAAHIKECAKIVLERHGGRVPETREQLLELPGVGVKTANLTLNLGFGIPAICVDTHVHRISNRLGWVESTSPGETETQLEEILPRDHWIEINSLLVSFGKSICTPLSPHCSGCPLSEICPRVGVTKSR